MLWQFRHTLVSEPKALVKFLYCIDWRYAHDVEHATALLKRWEQIDVDDALLLLSNDFTARNALIRHVRRFAVETLSKTARDEDIVSYLLQLVQALRYEPELSTSLKDNASSSTSKNSTSKNSEDDGASDTTSMTEEKKDEDDNSHEAMKSPLARFLITRAVKSPVCSCCFIIDTDTDTDTDTHTHTHTHNRYSQTIYIGILSRNFLHPLKTMRRSLCSCVFMRLFFKVLRVAVKMCVEIF